MNRDNLSFLDKLRGSYTSNNNSARGDCVVSHAICLDLEAMRAVDVRTVDPATLADIRDVKVDTELPQKERLIEYIRQIKNPYIYKYGKMVVKMNFVETEATLEDKLESYLLSL